MTRVEIVDLWIGWAREDGKGKVASSGEEKEKESKEDQLDQGRSQNTEVLTYVPRYLFSNPAATDSNMIP